jgi:cytochrome b6
MSELIAKLKTGIGNVTGNVRGFNLYNWLAERIEVFPAVFGYLSKKTVPQHRASVWYYFGGLTLFFFVIQIITGLLLLLYYKPTEKEAFASFIFLQKEVEFGWLIRQVHSWSANLMIFMAFTHMFSTYFMKAYRKPRELMWLTGFVLLLLVLGLGFTGYLLPWNQLSYFATKIPLGIAKAGPGGEILSKILQGDDEVSGETLTRMFSFHVVLLPGLTLLVLSAHLMLMQTLGTSIPMGYKEKGLVTGYEPFFPNFLLKDFIGWMLGFGLLIYLAVQHPWEVGEAADPLSSAPDGIKPEWYFWAQFQFLKDTEVLHIENYGKFLSTITEKLPLLFPVTFLGVATVVWGAVPFIDRKASREEKSPAFTIFGLLTLFFFLLEMTRVFVWSQQFKH